MGLLAGDADLGVAHFKVVSNGNDLTKVLVISRLSNLAPFLGRLQLLTRPLAARAMCAAAEQGTAKSLYGRGPPTLRHPERNITHGTMGRGRLLHPGLLSTLKS